MQEQPTLSVVAARARRTSQALLAVLLAALMSTFWTIGDWAQIAHLNLPDHDDMMRLAQIRDLIGGQGFNDWTQYRLAPPEGAPMHWSRINDLAPAALILALAPLLGQHAAEIAAVVAYPALLFALYLFLTAAIASRMVGVRAAPVAMIVAAVGYPANALFLPGRIDHHALQIVLVLGAVLALMHKPNRASGALAGLAIGISLGIGLEALLQLGALLAVLFLLWVARGAEERGRMLAFGLTLAGTTALLLLLTRPTFWSAAWCDSFTPASTTATFAAGAVFALCAVASPLLRDWRLRLVAGGGLSVVALGAVIAYYPVCLTGPYGPMDPFVRHAFMDNVVEAKGLLRSDILGLGLPATGLTFAALGAALWFIATRPLRRVFAWPAFAVLAISALLAFAQIRGAYIGSAIAAPFLAALIVAARTSTRWRGAKLAAAWSLSAGMLYLIVPQHLQAMFAPSAQSAFVTHQGCKNGSVWEQVDALPPGTVMASMDLAAYVIGGTHGMASVAAGYHRNNRGNRAMYDFFLASPDRARAIAREWRVAYVASCPTDFGELKVRTRYPASIASALIVDRPPAWLQPIPLRDTGLKLYRVVP